MLDGGGALDKSKLMTDLHLLQHSQQQQQHQKEQQHSHTQQHSHKQQHEQQTTQSGLQNYFDTLQKENRVSNNELHSDYQGQNKRKDYFDILRPAPMDIENKKDLEMITERSTNDNDGIVKPRRASFNTNYITPLVPQDKKNHRKVSLPQYSFMNGSFATSFTTRREMSPMAETNNAFAQEINRLLSPEPDSCFEETDEYNLTNNGTNTQETRQPLSLQLEPQSESHPKLLESKRSRMGLSLNLAKPTVRNDSYKVTDSFPVKESILSFRESNKLLKRTESTLPSPSSTQESSYRELSSSTEPFIDTPMTAASDVFSEFSAFEENLIKISIFVCYKGIPKNYIFG